MCVFGLFFTDDVYKIFFLRFLTGVGLNINSVGKDFVFEFTHDKYIQWTFSLKGIFAVVFLFITPMAGF